MHARTLPSIHRVLLQRLSSSSKRAFCRPSTTLKPFGRTVDGRCRLGSLTVCIYILYRISGLDTKSDFRRDQPRYKTKRTLVFAIFFTIIGNLTFIFSNLIVGRFFKGADGLTIGLKRFSIRINEKRAQSGTNGGFKKKSEFVCFWVPSFLNILILFETLFRGFKLNSFNGRRQLIYFSGLFRVYNATKPSMSRQFALSDH